MEIFKDIKRAAKEITFNKITKITKTKCRGMGTIFKLSKKEIFPLYMIKFLSNHTHKIPQVNRNYITAEQ